jgi:hypothetical protein
MGGVFVVGFAAVWAWVVAMPLAFLDPEYPYWLAKQRMLAACDLGSVLVLGDSRAAVDVIPARLGATAANLAVGYTFSTVAQNQLQALQSSFFYFLPSILLSGFMFPFRGMPEWAQWIGELFPLTHFLRVVRGIMLKGNGLAECWPDLWPVLLFLVATTAVALTRYRMSLD